MKIIDEKGRLFGKLNIIDLLVILFIIAVGALFAYRQVSERTTGSTAAKLTYQVRASGVDPLAYESIKEFVDPAQNKRDQLFSSDSNNQLLNGFIVDCVATPHVEYVATDNGELKQAKSSENDPRLDLVFTIEAQVGDTLTNKVGTQQVRVGASHFIKTTHFELYGSVLSVEWEPLS